MNSKVENKAAKDGSGEKKEPRKTYSKPQLEVLGDLHTVTLGGSVMGADDSGTSTQWDWPIY